MPYLRGSSAGKQSIQVTTYLSPSEMDCIHRWEDHYRKHGPPGCRVSRAEVLRAMVVEAGRVRGAIPRDEEKADALLLAMLGAGRELASCVLMGSEPDRLARALTRVHEAGAAIDASRPHYGPPTGPEARLAQEHEARMAKARARAEREAASRAEWEADRAGKRTEVATSGMTCTDSRGPVSLPNPPAPASPPRKFSPEEQATIDAMHGYRAKPSLGMDGLPLPPPE